MLKKLGNENQYETAEVRVEKASFPVPFPQGLEFSSPARGTWNIVHTGMLIPQSHQIFVCAKGCLRGVVLTAAEMGVLGRYSAVEIREENVLNGNMEELMIEGVSDVLKKLPYQPQAVLLFISCQHFFLAYDQQMVFRELRERFPEIDFTDCYMIPTLRKSGMTPDQKMRIQMYSLLQPRPKNPQKINLIGSNLSVQQDGELVRMLRENGYELQMLNWCETYEDYLDMASASLNIYYEPIAAIAGEDLKKRLGQDAWYLPFVYQADRLERNYQSLAEDLQIPLPDLEDWRQRADQAMREAKELIGETPVVVDYTFTFRILSFTRMLLEYGFSVQEIYADVFLPEEEADFYWIREHAPQIKILATSRPQMRFVHPQAEEKVLAIGQKAAYFAGTDYFVNVAESGGFFGFRGIIEIAEQMKEAFLQKKDRRDLIQRKGYRCESCI